MPEMTGLELVEQVHKLYPDTKCAIITTFSRSGYIKRALVAGVKGFLLKSGYLESSNTTINIIGIHHNIKNQSLWLLS